MLVIDSACGWTHPAAETDRGSKKRQPSGQANGSSVLAVRRHRCMASPVDVLRWR